MCVCVCVCVGGVQAEQYPLEGIKYSCICIGHLNSSPPSPLLPFTKVNREGNATSLWVSPSPHVSVSHKPSECLESEAYQMPVLLESLCTICRSFQQWFHTPKRREQMEYLLSCLFLHWNTDSKKHQVADHYCALELQHWVDYLSTVTFTVSMLVINQSFCAFF